MKSLLNLAVLLSLALGLWWWNQHSEKPVAKQEVAAPTTATQETPPVTGMEPKMSSEAPVSSTPSKPIRPPKQPLSPDLEAKYKAVLRTGIPDKLTSMITLFMEQRLEMAPDKGININPTDTEQATAFDLTWRDQGQDYKMHVQLSKTEATYLTEKYIYPYSIDLWVDNKVVLQFNGHMNLNQPENPTFQDVDVIAYETGPWEKNIKKLTLTN